MAVGRRSKRILLLASGGGHWTQLMRLKPAFAGHQLVFVGVKDFYRADVGEAPFATVRDVSRLLPWALPLTVAKLVYLMLRFRPALVVTTGALPGLIALVLAKRLLGARTVWIDSIANVEEVSMSGRKARRYADLWLTQWEHLARPEGPAYFGSVI
jgi:UDP-N-acetylglucosamine:LPS N-acetylglucosamine transferase